MDPNNGIPPAAKEINYASSHVAVTASKDGGRVLIVSTPLQERFVFALTPEGAELIGKALLAPSVIQP